MKTMREELCCSTGARIHAINRGNKNIAVPVLETSLVMVHEGVETTLISATTECECLYFAITGVLRRGVNIAAIPPTAQPRGFGITPIQALHLYAAGDLKIERGDDEVTLILRGSR